MPAVAGWLLRQFFAIKMGCHRLYQQIQPVPELVRQAALVLAVGASLAERLRRANAEIRALSR